MTSVAVAASSASRPPQAGVRGLRHRLERGWKRIDRALLRLQGRVDTPAYDRWLPYGYAALAAVVYIGLSLSRLHSHEHGLETAKFAQATWQISQGMRPEATLALGKHLLAEQGSFILYPVAALTAVFPRNETLLVVKSLALVLAIVPLWRLARTHGRLGIGAASAIVFGYAMYSGVHAMNLSDFMPAILAVPALMWAVVAGFDERKNLLLASCVFALSCRADLGLVVMGLGLLLLLERKRRIGALISLLGLVWFLVVLYGVQRPLDSEYGFLAPYSNFGMTPLGVVWGILSHPIEFLKVVGAEANFQILVTLLAPVLFLPLTAPRFLLPAVPLYVLYLGADVGVGRLREAAQNVPMTVFVFVATVFALRQSGRILVKRVRVERRVVLALMLTAIVFFVSDSTTSPFHKPWTWRTLDATDMARVRATERLPGDDVPVRASSSILPLLAERTGVYLLDATPPHELDPQIDELVEAAVANVDWVLFDRFSEGLFADDLLKFRTAMSRKGWEGEVDDDSRIDIYRFTGIVHGATVALEVPDPP